MKPLLSALLITGLLAGCSKDEQTTDGADVLTFNDFESMAGWIPENNSLTRELAHSGHYSIKVDPTQEFSLGYDMELGKVTPRKPKKIKLEAWAYILSGQSQAKLGLQISNPANGSTKVGDGIMLTEQVKEYRKWTAISKEITLPDSVASTDHIKIFLWRSYVPEAAFVDDVKVSVVE